MTISVFDNGLLQERTRLKNMEEDELCEEPEDATKLHDTTSGVAHEVPSSPQPPPNAFDSTWS